MLTTLEIKNQKPRSTSYKLSDGEGLFLMVSPSGGKHWRFKYHFAGKEKSLSFGKFPDVGLVNARLRRREAKDLIKSGIDPSLQRKRAKHDIIFRHDNTFGFMAEEWFQTNKSEWTERHAQKLWRMLELHVLPYIGSVPAADLKPRDLLVVIRKIEGLGATETAHRALWACSRIFKFAVVVGATEQNPAQNIGDGLKPHRGTGFPVIEPQEIPAFLRAAERLDARLQDKLALRLLMLTALRTGELRRCKWSDVHLARAEIRVPKEVMKMREGHIVPLSRQAIEALAELHSLTGHQEWLFPNPAAGKHPIMSENVINRLIDQMGYKGRIVGHSFRKLFSTVLNEHEFNPDAIERQLAHAERRKVRAAYNHARYLQTRRLLMQWWADYLDGRAVFQGREAGLDVGYLPSNASWSDLHRSRIDAGFHSAIPSALAHGDTLQDCLEA